MRVLKNKMIVPPGGWKFSVEQTGAELKAGSFPALVQLVNQHLSINSIAIKLPGETSLADIIENQICSRISPDLSKDTCSSEQVTYRRNSSKSNRIATNLGTTVLNRTLALISETKRKHKLFPSVIQEDAERRALRAISCSYMRPSNVCYSCKHQGPVDQSIGRKLRTSLDSKLHVCGVFDIYLRVLVHIPIDILEKYFPRGFAERLDDSFWLKPELSGK